MRNCAIPVAMAIVAAMSLPAQAAKYSCSWYKDGTQVKQCSIDSKNPGQPCEYSFSPTVTGTCLSSEDGDLIFLACSLHDPKLKLSDVIRSVGKASLAQSILPLIEQPGFGAVGLTAGFSPSTPGPIATAYREKAASPTMNGTCS